MPTRLLVIVVTTAFVYSAGSLALAHELRSVLTPLFTVCLLSVLFLGALTSRDRKLPVFELGAVFMLATTAYAALPLAGYALSGLQLSPLSHGRLFYLAPTPEDFAQAGWLHVVFMLAFAMAYLGIRTRQSVNSIALLPIAKNTLITVVAMWLALRISLLLLDLSAGFTFTPVYDPDVLSANRALYMELPLFAQQIAHNLYGILVLLNVTLVLVLVANWKSPLWRNVLIAWLVASIAIYLIYPGGRFALVSMLVAFGMSYHRFVRPFRIVHVVAGLVVLFAVFSAAGFLRGGGDLVTQGLANIEVIAERGDWRLVFTVADEFQNSYGSLLELMHNYEQGRLEPIPWQIYLTDILLPIPQQILPFSKVDPVDWYTETTSNPDYFNFSPLAQSVFGFGIPELIVRGGLIGIILAALHNWWARRPGSLWRNVLYVWLAIMSYNLIRNTSLYLLPIVIYRVVPVLVLVYLGEWMIRGAGRTRSSVHPLKHAYP